MRHSRRLPGNWRSGVRSYAIGLLCRPSLRLDCGHPNSSAAMARSDPGIFPARFLRSDPVAETDGRFRGMAVSDGGIRTRENGNRGRRSPQALTRGLSTGGVQQRALSTDPQGIWGHGQSSAPAFSARTAQARPYCLPSPFTRGARRRPPAPRVGGAGGKPCQPCVVSEQEGQLRDSSAQRLGWGQMATRGPPRRQWDRPRYRHCPANGESRRMSRRVHSGRSEGPPPRSRLDRSSTSR